MVEALLQGHGAWSRFSAKIKSMRVLLTEPDRSQRSFLELVKKAYRGGGVPKSALRKVSLKRGVLAQNGLECRRPKRPAQLFVRLSGSA